MWDEVGGRIKKSSTAHKSSQEGLRQNLPVSCDLPFKLYVLHDSTWTLEALVQCTSLPVEGPTPWLSIDEPVAMENNCLGVAMRFSDGRFLRERTKE